MHVQETDHYENLAILAAARTGARELRAFRAALDGSRPLGAQCRLLLEMAARGLVDINALIADRRKVQP